jgi:glycopeptide antibiotics resistance protein
LKLGGDDLKKSFIISLIITAAVFFLCSSFILDLTTYLHPFVIPIVIFCFFVFFYSLILFLRKENLEISYSLITGVFALYTVALLILLFFRPNTQINYAYNLIPFSTISFYLSGKVKMIIAVYNLAANIGLFVPFGIYLMFSMKKSILTHVFVPLICIMVVEIAQLLSHRGSLDIDDLILNFLGITIGYLMYPAFNKIVTIKKGARQY